MGDLLVPANEAVLGPLHGLQEDRRVRPVAARPEVGQVVGAGSRAATPGSPPSGRRCLLARALLTALPRSPPGGLGGGSFGRACADGSPRPLKRSARGADGCRSLGDQPPTNLPVERAGAGAVPGPAGASRPGAVPGPDHRLHSHQVGGAEPSVLRRSTAGLATVDGPNTSLWHDDHHLLAAV